MPSPNPTICILRNGKAATDGFTSCETDSCSLEAKRVDDTVTVGVGSCAVNDSLWGEEPECPIAACSERERYCGDELAIAMSCLWREQVQA